MEILSHRMNGYIQINLKKANMPYHKPANQNECIFLITRTFDASRVSSRRYFTYEFCHMKQLTLILNILHFQCF